MSGDIQGVGPAPRGLPRTGNSLQLTGPMADCDPVTQSNGYGH
jgi:hypothetical protein